MKKIAELWVFLNKKSIAPSLVTGSRRWLIRIMRGYRFLKETNQLDLISSVKNEITNVRFHGIDHNVSKFFFGAGISQAELITRQYLLMRFCSIGFNNALLHSLGSKDCPVVYPMPKLWQQVVAKNGFRVAKIRCSLMWVLYAGLFWCYGVLSILKYLCASLSKIIRPQAFTLGRYAYFVGLTAGNLPQPCRDGRSHDIFTWYVNWNGKTERLNALCHGVINTKECDVGGLPVMFNSHQLPLIVNLGGLARFISWAFVAILHSIFDLFFGRWWHAMLLAEFAKSAIVRFQPTDKLARDYMFNNSGWIYRPLWTYEAEKKGSRIVFYFYSTHCESFKRPNGYPIQAKSWQVVSWPLYLVWDKYQADFVRRAVNQAANIEIVGPVWFQSSSVEIPKLPVGSVAVFDVQPHRNSLYQTFGLDSYKEFYVPKTCNQFLLDIYSVVGECKRAMVHKRKRNTGLMLHPQYENLINFLMKADNVFPIEPDISAIRVIENCFAVISMPFTSTALLGRELGKPSIYYDPHGAVQKDDRAAHGIMVLSGKDELREWLLSLKAK